MKAAVDLHIHTALSPCADKDMTPNNIVNMALLKGLDIIAITDHNSFENFEAVEHCASKAGILAVPGMEVETREEIHLVCLFPGAEEGHSMQQKVYNALPRTGNRTDIFGDQLVMDENDLITGRSGRFLITAADLGTEEVFSCMESLGGVVIPAHVDRSSYSMLSSLGFIPQSLGIKYLEISRGCDPEEFLHKYESLRGYGLIRSSDAHFLGDILERETLLEMDKIDVSALICMLRGR